MSGRFQKGVEQSLVSFVWLQTGCSVVESQEVSPQPQQALHLTLLDLESQSYSGTESHSQQMPAKWQNIFILYKKIFKRSRELSQHVRTLKQAFSSKTLTCRRVCGVRDKTNLYAGWSKNGARKRDLQILFYTLNFLNSYLDFFV